MRKSHDTYKVLQILWKHRTSTYKPLMCLRIMQHRLMRTKQLNLSSLLYFLACLTSAQATKAEQVIIPIGFHDGSGKIGIDATEQAKLIAGNIKNGVTILGVTGELEPSSNVTVQSKTVTPSTTKQTVIPDDGTDYLSQVVVEAIPYVEAANYAGGTTVTIAG